MTFFKWDPDLDTGITVIDTQHQRIIEYINALDTAVKEKDSSIVAEVVEQLIDYTVTHFTFEEVLMAQYDYPYLEAHRKVHEAFAVRVLNYQKRMQAGEDVSRRLLSDLRIWLTNHIKRDDKDYVSVCMQVDAGWLTRTLNRFFGT